MKNNGDRHSYFGWIVAQLDAGSSIDRLDLDDDVERFTLLATRQSPEIIGQKRSDPIANYETRLDKAQNKTPTTCLVQIPVLYTAFEWLGLCRHSERRNRRPTFRDS